MFVSGNDKDELVASEFLFLPSPGHCRNATAVSMAIYLLSALKKKGYHRFGHEWRSSGLPGKAFCHYHLEIHKGISDKIKKLVTNPQLM